MTGAVINLNFVTGLDYDTGIAAVGKNLFVAYQYQSPQIAYATIAEYAATTGAVISTDLLSDVLGARAPTPAHSRCQGKAYCLGTTTLPGNMLANTTPPLPRLPRTLLVSGPTPSHLVRSRYRKTTF